MSDDTLAIRFLENTKKHPDNLGALATVLFGKNKKALNEFTHQFRAWLNWPLCKVSKEYVQLLVQVIFLSNKRFVLLATDQGKPALEKRKLLFDGRDVFLGCPAVHRSKPLLIVCHQQQHVFCISRTWPGSEKEPMDPRQNSLAKLLALPLPLADPQSLDELTAYLQRHNLADSVSVEKMFHLCSRQSQPWYRPMRPLAKIEHQLVAVPDSNLRLRYVRANPLGTRQSKKTRFPSPVSTAETGPIKHNNNVSVNIRSVCLGLATKLGLLALDEVKLLVSQLSACVGTISHCVDDMDHLRMLAYCNQGVTFSIRLDCAPGSKNDQKMVNFFSHVLEEQLFLGAKIAALLEPLMKRLLPYATRSKSLHRQLFNRLQRCIKNTLIITCFSNDSLLHHIKMHFAAAVKTFVKQRLGQKFNGVTLCLDANNLLNGLCSQICHIRNVAQYFDPSQADFDLLLHRRHFADIYQGWTGFEFDVEETVLPHAFFNSFPPGRCETLEAEMLQRGLALVTLWQHFASFVVEESGLDICTLSFQSLSGLAFKIVWSQLAQMGGPLYHPIEKVLTSNDKMIRKFSHGGFCYSAQTLLEAGDPLFDEPGSESGVPSEERAQMIASFDIHSSYGFAASSMSAARGFGVTYQDGQYLGFHLRCRGFEFRGVLVTVLQWTQVAGPKLITVFSNFSPHGLFWVGPYPLDLVGVFDDGTLILIQFDGHFAHGCRRCQTRLPRYIHNRDKAELEDVSQRRDNFILQWISDTKCPATYHVLTDCCSPGFDKENLDLLFATVEPFQSLVAPYYAMTGELDQCPECVTFLAVVTGFQAHPADNFPALQVWVKERGYVRTTSGTVMVSKDYYNYLRREHNFIVLKVHWVLYHPTCPVLPAVYARLLSMRNSGSSQKAAFIKAVINYSAGYMGLNPNKTPRPKFRITSNVAYAFNTKTTRIVHTTDIEGQVLMVAEKFVNSRQTYKTSELPLPLFFQIIDFGKMRLTECLHFFHRHLRHNTNRFLYCQVDSIVMGFATIHLDTILGAGDCPKGRRQFHDEWHALMQKKVPGCLKLEWLASSDRGHWQFVTARHCHYALLADAPESNRCKISGLRALDPVKTFEIGLALLNSLTKSVWQTKRVKKALDRNVKHVLVNVGRQSAPPEKDMPDPPLSTAAQSLV